MSNLASNKLPGSSTMQRARGEVCCVLFSFMAMGSLKMEYPIKILGEIEYAADVLRVSSEFFSIYA